jgi:DNA transformation protein
MRRSTTSESADDCAALFVRGLPVGRTAVWLARRATNAREGAVTTADGKAIADLPGLGPKSQAMLARAGIASVEDLQRLGAVAAYAAVRRANPNASLNLLWALESALTGQPWQEVAREHRTSLLLALDDHERRAASTAERARRGESDRGVAAATTRRRR